MSYRNSVITISKNINIDRNYKNTLALNSSSILNLMQSSGHMLYNSSDYSFIRPEMRVKVQASYSTLFDANYCCIVNQNERQFFFIDEIIYISDSVSELKITEDVLTTYKDAGFKNAYYERQHPQSDLKYSNTVSEDISPSNYACGNEIQLDVSPTFFRALFSEYYDATTREFVAVPDSMVGQSSVTKQWNSLYIIEDRLTDAHLISFNRFYSIYVYNGKGGSLLSFFTEPTPGKLEDTINFPTELSGYQPKNNKLFSYPYTLCHMTNNAGSTIDYKPELLQSGKFIVANVSNDKAQSICYPYNYMGRIDNTDHGLQIDNFPTIPVVIDSYTEWLGQAQNGLKKGIMGKLFSAGLGVLLAPVTGGLSLISTASELTSIGSQAMDVMLHVDNTPDTVIGRADGNILNMYLDKYHYLIQFQNVIPQEAERIDDFFTRFGYAQKCIMPTYTTNHRFHCHFLKTAVGESVIAGIPHSKAEIINNAFSSGITFWDSNENVGNFNLK